MSDTTALDVNQYPSMLFGTAPGGRETLPSQEQPPPPPPQEPPPPPQEPPALPPQGDQPQAFNPGWLPRDQQPPATPAVTPGVNGRPPPPPIDEMMEQTIGSQNDQRKYDETLLSHESGKPLVSPTKLTRADFPQDQAKIEEMKQIVGQVPTQKAYNDWTREINRLQGIVDRKIAAQNAASDRAFVQKMRDATHQSDEQRMTVEQRVHQAQYLNTAISDAATELAADQKDPDPEAAQKGAYIYTVSPLNTLNTGKPDAPKYDQLLQTANNIAAVNGHLLPNQVMRYVMKIGSPVDIRSDPHAVGMNGRRGSGGANYSVQGRDPRDNYLLRMEDGVLLSVNPNDKRLLDAARIRGYAAGQKLLQQQKDAAVHKPGLIERAYQTVFPPLPKAP